MKKKTLSFIKYFTVGGIKTVLTIVLLWLFIDVLELQPRNLYRTGVIVFIFLLSFFMYDWIGYSKH